MSPPIRVELLERERGRDLSVATEERSTRLDSLEEVASFLSRPPALDLSLEEYSPMRRLSSSVRSEDGREDIVFVFFWKIKREEKTDCVVENENTCV